MQFENFHALVDEHRRNWPVERIAADLEAFRADCARVLSHVPGFENGTADAGLAPFWIRMMFPDDEAPPSVRP
jgi:hypothetical protein